MKKQLDEIRTLLDEIEQNSTLRDSELSPTNFDALEIPSLLTSVVDYLQPELKPYELAVYLHLLSKSIIKTGDQYTRASVRGMATIVKSASGQSEELSQGAVRNALKGLKQKKVIIEVGEPSREGTLYKIEIPEQIPICLERMKANTIKEQIIVDKKKELDFYNIEENRINIFERDAYKCYYCGKQLTRFSATLDHVIPVSKGGNNSYDNLVTACHRCNSERRNKPMSDFIVEKDS